MNPRAADDVLRDIIQLAVGARAELRAAHPDVFKSDRTLANESYIVADDSERAAKVSARAAKRRKLRAPREVLTYDKSGNFAGAVRAKAGKDGKDG